jgi:hypothetical protein
MNNVLKRLHHPLLRTTQTPAIAQMARQYSMLYAAQPQLDLFMVNSLIEEAEKTLECKKNKTTKQAERKRKKRKTGANISIR